MQWNFPSGGDGARTWVGKANGHRSVAHPPAVDATPARSPPPGNPQGGRGGERPSAETKKDLPKGSLLLAPADGLEPPT